MRFLSIDPSINFCGYCAWNDKKIIEYGLLNPQTKTDDYIEKSRSIFSQIKHLIKRHGIEKLVLEIPTHFGVAGYLARESGSVFKLTFVCGMICSLDNVQTVEPHRWKGQLSKDVVFRRMNALKLYKGIDFLEINNNVADGIAIGHWANYGKV